MQEAEDAGGHRYLAFISYSHRDRRWGDWLHRALEGFRVPKQLRAGDGRDALPARVYPVFRDREELSSSADLGSNLREALAASKCLVVVCSPSAARSPWVNEEVRLFKSMGREHRVLCLIVDGEPNASAQPGNEASECFPPAVRFRVDAEGNLTDERTEPVAADARAHADGKLNAKLKLIAGILEVGFDDLKQRDQRRRQRRLIVATSAMSVIALLTTGLAVLAWFGWQRAERQESLALDARDQAERIASTMLYDFRDKLEPLGRLDLLRDNAVVVRDYYLALPAEHQTDATERQRASALMNVGDVLLAQGATGEAKTAFEKSETILSRLRKRYPDSADAQRGWTVIANRLGDQRLLAGDMSEARRFYESSVARTRALHRDGAADPRWSRDLVVGLYKLGQLELEAGNTDAALQALDEARTVAEAANEAAPTKATQVDVQTVLSGLALAQEQRRDKAAALELLDASVALERRLVEDYPEDFALKEGLAVTLGRLSGIHLELLQLDRAMALAAEQRELLETMAARDDSNARWLRMLAVARTDAARLAERSGDLATARSGYSASVRAFEDSAQLRPTDLEAQFDVAIAYNAIGDLEDTLGNFQAALGAYERALALGARLLRRVPDNPRWRNAVASYQGKIGSAALALGDVPRAREALASSVENMRRLAAADPKSRQFQRDLSIALGRVAYFHRMSGEPAKAIAHYEQCRAIDERLLAQAPEDAEAVTDLAVTQSQLGRAQQTAGNLVEAEKAFAAALSLRRRLGRLAPSSVGWRAEVGESLVALGDIAFAASNAPRAGELYEEALGEYRVLLAAHGDNQRWRRQAALAYNRAGGVKATLRRLGDARRHYRAAYDIANQLVAEDPDNVVWQTDLILGLRLLAQSAELPQQLGDAIDYNRRAIARLQALREAARLPPRFEPWIGEAQADLVRLEAMRDASPDS